MNELIEKIYAEACINAGYLDERGFCEEFALMIVKESAEVVNYYHSRNEPVTPQQILRHFGVEE
jgi:hypothetical protein